MSRYDEIVDELYGLTPDVFVKRRNEVAKDAKADGETALAKDISRLRRPTQAAWAINQWVRTNPDDCDQVTALAADLSAAQRRSAADTMRELSRRRQELINSSADGVAGTASSLGVRLSDSAVREVATTLRAAIADAAVLDDLRRGRLVTSAEYSGFGPAGVFVVPDPPAEPKRTAGHDHDADREGVDADSVDENEDSDESARVRQELEARIARAEDGEQSARKSLGDASSEVHEASAEVDELVAEARDLREQLSRVEDSLRFARQRLSTAEQGRSEAKVALRDAVAEANKLRAALADL
ncbi:hypothetical protein JTZ10_15390 [Gordonia rubripertincta]|uniref:Uncharacterized protein n=1 Tax=Gordonia rubripertincta TaxID=36822 RepID=A0AAW4G7N7_GORRU|nr:hypothetical protein [Gordonia rubripertincta]MBM7279134.1 hypothetical protein [Gordonia rubripertincta]QMU19928.1 hypothetical protein H3V45_18030 [Gordonia rubripertincta]